MMNKTTAACFSRGILKVKHLNAFVPELNIISDKKHLRDSKAVIGWGFKSTANKARNYAADSHLPYIALEDGFLRSIGLGVDGAAPASLVVDHLGIYYDARQLSYLEQLITHASSLSTAELAQARQCIDAIQYYRLSKYNPNSLLQCFSKQPKVVVIDQTQGDASVDGALANKQTFVDMLNEALLAHPDETIWVKVHPDVLTGKKKGFLYPLPVKNERVALCSETVNPWEFFDSVTDLYTVSSLMGFEALMGGVNVHCFGMPFYAGWGLTSDKLTCSRRNEPRSLEQVFYAAYIQYSRYVDPITGSPCRLEDIIHYFSDMLRVNKRACPVNMSALSFVRQSLIKRYIRVWGLIKNNNTEVVLLWGKKNALNNKAKALRIEDGFIRSVGLGVHLSKPASLVCDSQGIYFDSTQVSDLESCLNEYDLTAWEQQRTECLIEALIKAKVTKYNVGESHQLELPDDRVIILVPGQVESDASIQFGAPIYKTNEELLTLVRKHNSDAFIIYKPHPDVVSGERDKGNWEQLFIHNADLVVTDLAMDSLLDLADEVHTLTSLAGFEALLRGIKVFTYGLPFYAGWGLTYDLLLCERRQRKRTLAELIFCSLVLYPTYIDPITDKQCSVEQIIERIQQLKSSPLSASVFSRLLLLSRRIKNKLHFR
ncbi:capsular polysaccharide biosynthesis protein [Psychromonas ossibalaenae]|uniref:capsular polysaccharide biosynthesis protein n=1 Tax=Psychromonas ossibalaenae TaxID=444922 RepID=UPI0004770B59|nr:capsular polysaccharide biosynthesis protein [Psychromonas ossibalaenae]